MAVNMYDARLTSAMIVVSKNVSDKGVVFYLGCIDGNSKIGKISNTERLYLRDMVLQGKHIPLKKAMHSAKEVVEILRQGNFSDTLEMAYIYGLAFGSFGGLGFDENILRQIEAVLDEKFLDEAEMVLFGEYEE